MFFYVFPYIIVFVFSIYIYKLKKQKIGAFNLFVILLPALLVAIFRGNIGVDTATYSRYFLDKINQTTESDKFEYGFEKIIDLFVFLNLNITGIFAVIAILTTITLSMTFSGSKNSAILLFLVFFPLFYVDSTMNALRYGLSFSIASLAVDFLIKKKLHFFVLASSIAISIQITSVVILASFLIARFNWKLILVLSVIISFFLSDISQSILPYLIDKKEAYSLSYSPSKLSGIFPLIFFIILYGLFVINVKSTKVFPEIHLFLILEVFSFILAKYSYSGLRFQLLFLYALIISIKNGFDFMKSNQTFFKSLFILSILFFAVFIKNIVTVESDLDSKYLPYEFFWERK